MSGPGAILREIHRLRRNAADLQSKIEQGPRQFKMQQDKVARQEQIFHQAGEEVKQLKVWAHDKEVSLKATDQQIKKYHKQLNEIMSKKEYDALQHELTHARGKVAALEDEILAVLIEIEGKAALLPQLEKNQQEARAQAELFSREYQPRMADFAQQLHEVLQKLGAAEALLPGDLQPQYQRLTGWKGEDALAVVDQRTCTACHTEITSQNYNDLLQGLFVLCKSCGRILYLPD